MERGRFLWDEEAQKWAPRHEVLAKRAAAVRPAVSNFPCPMVIGTMPETRSMIDGRIYSDKSSYYRHVERNGCAIVGFDKNWESQVKPKRYDERQHEADVVADVKKSIEQVTSYGGVPPDAA
jgi:hypothetical protein